ncbi:MAG: outer membrane protein assembly factor BamA [Alphaproteobacteria bacterium]|nr:outer membrane protein assembly factor BamA [Alphaproteobacteria bacterium]
MRSFFDIFFRFFSRLVAFSVTLIWIFFPLHDAGAASLRRIDVRGNERIETQTILGHLPVSPGQEYDYSLVNLSLKRLYSTNLFFDVDIKLEGRDLIVEVVENPVVNLVAFEGNKSITDKKLRLQTKIKSRSTMTRAAVQRDIEKILFSYNLQGFYAVRVEPQVIELPGNRINLVFNIDEGHQAKVGVISFLGNKFFSDQELSRVIMTSRTSLMSWLDSSDVYNPERLKADQVRLKSFYFSRGYADFDIISAAAELDFERDKFVVTIAIDEGERYLFGPIRVRSSVAYLDPNSLSHFVKTFEGDTYDLTKISLSVEELTMEVSRLGYPFVRVRKDVKRDPDNKIISVDYFIEEGPKAYVERINILGNTKTRDYVIRREFDIAEGDRFNFVLFERAQRRLLRLGFFEELEITTKPGSAPDLVVVNVRVKEASTGNIGLNGGYSTLDGFIADLSLKEKNFLRKGQYVRLSLAFSSKKRSLDFSFVEPYFLNRRLSLQLNAFSSRSLNEKNLPYKRGRNGFSVGLGFPISQNLLFTPRYEFMRENVYDIEEGASLAVKSSAGIQNVSSIGYALSFDTVNSRTDPRKGIYAQFSQSLAGVGGDVRFIRSMAKIIIYKELYQNIVGLFKFSGGHILGWGGQKIGLLESFFKGGSFVRGFEASGLGPRDANKQDSLGGKIFAGFTAEFQFPLLPESLEINGFKGAVFADLGTLYASDFDGRIIDGKKIDILDSSKFRSSIGVGIIWDSPLGPLRADWAYILRKEVFDKEQLFSFGVETKF